MKIRYSGYLLDPTGYGEFARRFVEMLYAAGHELSVVPISRRSGPSSFGDRGALIRRLSLPMAEPDVNIVNTLPGLFGLYALEGCLNVGFTMCEGGKIPETWPHLCDSMDGILVPTGDNRRVFQAAVSVPVRELHMAAPREMPEPVQERSGSSGFSFLSIFDWTERKNPRALIRAYTKAFKREEPVLLRVKTHLRGRRSEERLSLACERVKALRASVKPSGEAPRIQVIEGRISEGGIEELYRSSDAYVSAHRAEGWSMPIWEAMLRAMPVVATGFSGNMVYMTEENSFPVRFFMSPVTMSHPHFDSTMKWADVDEDELSEKMRYVFEHRNEAREIGLRGRAHLEKKFSLANSSRMFEEAVSDFSQLKKAKEKTGDTWPDGLSPEAHMEASL